MPFLKNEDKLAYQRKWYGNHRKIAVVKTRERKSRIKKWFEEYKKDLKCSKCPEDHPDVMDFHHKERGKKEGTIAYFVANGYSIKRIKEELDKCIVLCANCHRKIHNGNKNL